MTVAALIAFGVDVVAKVIKAVIDAKEGKITPEQALARIADAGRQDDAVDATVDAAIARKFPTDEGDET